MDARLCPYCGAEAERDEVDVGVGMIPAGPWGCPSCHAFEADYEELLKADVSDEVRRTGWWRGDLEVEEDGR